MKQVIHKATKPVIFTNYILQEECECNCLVILTQKLLLKQLNNNTNFGSNTLKFSDHQLIKLLHIHTLYLSIRIYIRFYIYLVRSQHIDISMFSIMCLKTSITWLLVIRNFETLGIIQGGTSKQITKLLLEYCQVTNLFTYTVIVQQGKSILGSTSTFTSCVNIDKT